MLPSLSEFGINQPVYLRKIDSRVHWQPEGVNSIGDRSFRVAERLFREAENLYSLWLVETEQEFYSVVAALSSTRSPRNQNIDFIWIQAQELESLGLSVKRVAEGLCLHAQPLHFNVQIDSSNAIKLCHKLIDVGREAYRCKKTVTAKILAHQEDLGCKAVVSGFEACECENWWSDRSW